MPAATMITGGVMAAAAASQAIGGISETSKAKKDLNNFDRGALTNVYDDMPISLLGSNLAIEENSRSNASYVDAARGGGIRGIMGALPALQAGNNNANRQVQLDLDNQVQERNYAIAGDEQRIQGMQEQRDNAELAGIGRRIDTGRQNTWSGIRGIANSAAFVGSNLESSERDTQTTASTATANNTVQGYNAPQLAAPMMPSYMNTLKLQDERYALNEAAPKNW